MISESPNLSTLIQAHIRAELASTYVCQPARIVAFNVNTQRATVELLVRDFVIDRETPTVEYDVEPTRIADVPVMALGSPTMGWFWIPPSVGDTVLLWFTDRSLAEVKGDAGTYGDPVHVTDVGALHDLTNAVAMLIPNISTLASSLTYVGVGATNGPTIVPGTGKHVCLGDKNPSAFAARADTVDTHLAALRTAVNALGAAVPPLGSVAASKVKVA